MSYRARVAVVRSAEGIVKFDNWDTIQSVYYTAKDEHGKFMLSESDREYICQKQTIQVSEKVSVERTAQGNVVFNHWEAIRPMYFTAKDEHGNFVLSESDREYIYQKQEETRP